MELEYLPLFKELGYGATIWSPLASGILTGKYNNGIPEGSRMALEGYGYLLKRITQHKIEIVRKLEGVAKELGCNTAQLAIAWCLKNPDVSTVITGASHVEQVHQNMKSLDVVPRLTEDVMARIEEILQNKPYLDIM
jgi:aryl-alcohol dehydrogenase-like predicted oxidoreductase